MGNEIILKQLGQQLKALRKSVYPGDDQATFAVRVKVSRNTYLKMEKGSGNVSIASYLDAAKLYGLEESFLNLFLKPKKENYFEFIDD